MPVSVITRESPDTADAIVLINELEAHLALLYPAESRHGFSVAKLLAEDVHFFLLQYGGIPAGCGGVKLFGTADGAYGVYGVYGVYGEIKRMYVRPQFRGMGFGKLMLNHLADYALANGVNLLRLETGIHQREAIALYERMGFRRIPPFGEYKEDPLSVFYEKQIHGRFMPADAQPSDC